MSSSEQSGSTNTNDDEATTPEVDPSAVSGSPATEPTFVYDPLAPDPASGTPGTLPATPEDDSTVGTGTSIALGCIAGTMVLIVFAILILFAYSVIVD